MGSAASEMEARSPLGWTHGAFVEASRARGERPGAASRVYTEFYREGRGTPAPAPPHRVLEGESAEGPVRKFLLRVPGGSVKTGSRALPVLGERELETESVVIPMETRSGDRTFTLCVSSQVGCAMGCEFCET